MSQRWTINQARATHQNLDGEVIIVDLPTGMYFSLRDSASIIWDALEHEPSTEGLMALFSTEPAVVAERVPAFLQALRQHELITSIAGEAAPLAAAPVPWTEPRFEAYSDMQNLLLADPIHEVDETGWPRISAPNA